LFYFSLYFFPWFTNCLIYLFPTTFSPSINFWHVNNSFYLIFPVYSSKSHYSITIVFDIGIIVETHFIAFYKSFKTCFYVRIVLQINIVHLLHKTSTQVIDVAVEETR